MFSRSGKLGFWGCVPFWSAMGPQTSDICFVGVYQELMVQRQNFKFLNFTQSTLWSFVSSFSIELFPRSSISILLLNYSEASVMKICA